MGNINRVKRKPKKWKKIAANYVSDKRLVSQVYKGTQYIILFLLYIILFYSMLNFIRELINSIRKNLNNPVKNGEMN